MGGEAHAREQRRFARSVSVGIAITGGLFVLAGAALICGCQCGLHLGVWGGEGTRLASEHAGRRARNPRTRKNPKADFHCIGARHAPCPAVPSADPDEIPATSYNGVTGPSSIGTGSTRAFYVGSAYAAHHDVGAPPCPCAAYDAVAGASSTAAPPSAIPVARTAAAPCTGSAVGVLGLRGADLAGYEAFAGVRGDAASEELSHLYEL